MMVDFIKNYFEEMKSLLDKISLEDTKKVTDLIYDAYNNNKQIFIIGNGGSAATASHFACDLNKGP
jgi:D-sedoheptulose 7-phosphate isomerase